MEIRIRPVTQHPRLLPFFAALIALLILIAYVPALSLWLPGVFR